MRDSVTHIPFLCVQVPPPAARGSEETPSTTTGGGIREDKVHRGCSVPLLSSFSSSPSSPTID